MDVPLDTFSHNENLAPNPSGAGSAISHEPYVVYFADITAPAIDDITITGEGGAHVRLRHGHHSDEDGAPQPRRLG